MIFIVVIPSANSVYSLIPIKAKILIVLLIYYSHTIFYYLVMDFEGNLRGISGAASPIVQLGNNDTIWACDYNFAKVCFAVLQGLLHLLVLSNLFFQKLIGS